MVYVYLAIMGPMLVQQVRGAVKLSPIFFQIQLGHLLPQREEDFDRFLTLSRELQPFQAIQ